MTDYQSAIKVRVQAKSKGPSRYDPGPFESI